MNNIEGNQDVGEMIDSIRTNEQEDQDREQLGEDGEEGLQRPSKGKQPKIEAPESRKKYIPIRNRETYKELLKAACRAMAHLETVCSKRNLFESKHEMEALAQVSHTAYKAMLYIQDKLKENEERKNLGGPKENAKPEETNGNRRHMSVRERHRNSSMSLD